jgi:pyruvate, water dikinase
MTGAAPPLQRSAHNLSRAAVRLERRSRRRPRPFSQEANMAEYVRWFDDLGMGDVGKVGGKNASLGEMTRNLKAKGVSVPEGFATTAELFRAFISTNQLDDKLADAIAAFHAGTATLQQTGARIRQFIVEGRFPDDASRMIVEAYEKLGSMCSTNDPSVAVRSSATAEDLPDASFAGQQESYLNVHGAEAVLQACKECFASLFTDRAISYREAKKFDHLAIALSCGVQRMVRSDKAGSGVMFSIDPETGFPNSIVISAGWGLGEFIVKGTIDPDKYVVFKPLLDNATGTPIIERALGAKERKLVYSTGVKDTTQELLTTAVERETFVLRDSEVLSLARWARLIEQHYGRAMDMEWAKDGETGELFIVQARPETVHAGRDRGKLLQYRLKQDGKVIIQGSAVGSAIATGPACRIDSPDQIQQFKAGAILVTGMTNPDWVPIMKMASGIVTDHGGTTSHAAIVSRELGVPAIVGTGRGTDVIADGQKITLDCAAGEVGKVYDGELEFERQEMELSGLPQVRTHIMINLADPGAAYQWWRLPVKGVGLARLEFIISSLKVHPMAAAHPERLEERDRRALFDLAKHYPDPASYFVDRLAMGIGQIASVFYPEPAIVRLSDFKTNEYHELPGGSLFEPEEENPMIGFRGASRYADDRYRDGFALECRALKQVREEMGFQNVIIMLPFVRTPQEADQVLAEMARHGLERGKNGLQVYMMCEIPSNVILAEEFAKRFDGFSIGSNDLTQLVLGVDRDSGILTGRYNAREEAVKRMIAAAIHTARKCGIKVGLCGQAPSDYPEYAGFLVNAGINSMSLNPDSVLRTWPIVANAEAQLLAEPVKEKEVVDVGMNVMEVIS